MNVCALQRQKHPANMVNELLRRTQENRNSAWSRKKTNQQKRTRERVRGTAVRKTEEEKAGGL